VRGRCACRGVDLARCERRHRCVHAPTRLARICAPPAVSLPAHHRCAARRALRPVPLVRRPRLPRILAARTHRDPDRRRGNARTLVDGLDAQPGANARRVGVDQTPPSGSGRRWSTQISRTTPWAGNGRRAAGQMQPRSSASSIPCCRPRGTIPRASTSGDGFRNSPGSPTVTSTSHGRPRARLSRRPEWNSAARIRVRSSISAPAGPRHSLLTGRSASRQSSKMRGFTHRRSVRK
jgi:hypothetical protein